MQSKELMFTTDQDDQEYLVGPNKRKIDKGYSGRFLSTRNSDLRPDLSLSRRKKFTNIFKLPAVNIKNPFSKQETHITPTIQDKRSAPDRVSAKPRLWTEEEDELLRAAVQEYGERQWKKIAERIPGRNHTQALQRWSKVLAPGLKKGQWSAEEDKLLLSLAQKQIEAMGPNRKKVSWGKVAKGVPGRTAKQCRERWVNNLNPAINRGPWTREEDQIILSVYSVFPKKWATIAKKLNGRTENAVKIRYKTLSRMDKQSSPQNFDTATHTQPQSAPPYSMLGSGENINSFSNFQQNSHPISSQIRDTEGEIIKLEKSFSDLNASFNQGPQPEQNIQDLRSMFIKENSERSVASSISITDMIAKEILALNPNSPQGNSRELNSYNSLAGLSLLNMNSFGSLNNIALNLGGQMNAKPELMKSGSDRSTLSAGILRDLMGFNNDAN
eukprot:snap_masked-scaffold_18-processed-gene-6.56-mRNA-1 protein AED:0.15 eAED:0.15 QI:62/0.5/0.33/1/0.5/0.33/3/0/441